MNAAETGVRNRIHSAEPRLRQITFWTFGLTSEHFAIESSEPLPISGDKIGMHVFRPNWHSCSLYLRRFTQGKRKVMQGRIAFLKYFVRIPPARRCFAKLRD